MESVFNGRNILYYVSSLWFWTVSERLYEEGLNVKGIKMTHFA